LGKRALTKLLGTHTKAGGSLEKGKGGSGKKHAPETSKQKEEPSWGGGKHVICYRTEFKPSVRGGKGKKPHVICQRHNCCTVEYERKRR